MRKYKIFLKTLLTVNILFVLVVAGLGYRAEQREKKIAEVNNTLETRAENGKNEIPAKEETLGGNTAAWKKTTSEDGKTGEKVVPVGQTVGIYINTNGILVIDTGEVTDMAGEKTTPAKNKLMPGDYIVSLNGEKMQTKKKLIEAITNCNGEDLLFGVRRKEELIEVKVEPVQTGTDEYKVGIWVRDDLQGLGTVTYVDDNTFGALGHSINDTDTGNLLEVSGGEIYAADIFGVEKGSAGSPGEIEGMIAYETENVVGEIDGNQLYGIYGTITDSFQKEIEGEEAVEVASVDEVKMGKAYIQSWVSGERQLYEIEIVDLHKNEHGDLEMEIMVTDENLIALTGGIVQGMSGSPILQNGKLIGAVTHVFVEEPKKGYGIFVETMRENVVQAAN